MSSCQCLNSSDALVERVFTKGTVSVFSVTITRNASNSQSCSCKFVNEAGEENLTIPILKGSNNGRWIKGHCVIRGRSLSDLEKSPSERSQLKDNFTRMLNDIYSCVSYVNDTTVDRFSEGSIIVDFKLYGIAVLDDAEYLAPFKDAVAKSSVINGLEIGDIKPGAFVPPDTTTSAATPGPTPTASTETKPTPPSGPDDIVIIIIVIVVVVVLVVVVILLVYYYCNKKRIRKKEDDPSLVPASGAVAIPMDNAPRGRNNEGYSPSEYAKRGPSHADPAYDSVDRRPRDTKDKNDNGTQQEADPAYAAVDTSKKTKKKNADEIIYAQVQTNGDNTSGADSTIVLVPLPKGKDVKMPEAYQESDYAEIVRTIKPADDTQNPVGGGTDDASLGAFDDNPPETDKGAQKSGQAAKNEEQKPPDDHQEKPLTKEDSGKDGSDATENSVTKFKSSQPESSC